MRQILLHHDFQGQIRCLLLTFSTSRTNTFITLLHKLILKSNMFIHYEEEEASVTIAVMERVKLSSCLAKHSGLCSLKSTPKGLQIRLLQSHDLEYIEKTTKTTMNYG